MQDKESIRIESYGFCNGGLSPTLITESSVSPELRDEPQDNLANITATDDGNSSSCLQTSFPVTRTATYNIGRGTANTENANQTQFQIEISFQQPNPEPMPGLRKNSQLHQAIGKEDELIGRIPKQSTVSHENIAFSNMQLNGTKSSSSKKLYRRIPDYCYFCRIVVHNFARHVSRNHSAESAVAEILSKPLKSKERRHLLDKLRRKGNFLASGKQCFKSVRRLYVRDRSTLPCDNCLGFFSSKLLYRHRNKCYGYGKGRAQAAGQAKLVRNSRVTQRLKQEVFPHMRADKVSLEAKNDTLICTFGAWYINTHQGKHVVHVASRKMRQLAKILIEVRKLEPSITDMFSSLQPKYFDLFVKAAKRIGNYDVDKGMSMSPTFVMDTAAHLKKCCDIAITCANKRHSSYLSVFPSEAEGNLKTLIYLFQTNWGYELSTQAVNNFNLNKRNKTTIISLASDLKLLRQYLLQIADDASIKLKDNKSTLAYNTLLESAYCRIILLNRKRYRELQSMSLHTYLNPSSENQDHKEFNQAVSSAEQILMKTLKRVIIKEKGRRDIPVLFSRDVQSHINILLKMRRKYVPKENRYLFAKPNSMSHIIGYQILSKHAECSGAKNPFSVTSICLQKQLATLSQLFNLSENEVEQLLMRMGHTPGVDMNSYKLPDEIYQRAKISKLLLLMENGSGNEFRGKSLDEINIDMEEDLLGVNEKNDESDHENIPDDDNLQNIDEPALFTGGEDFSTPTPIPKQGKFRKLVPWTPEQKTVVKEFFKQNIKVRKAPRKSECENLKLKHQALLENKDWLKIKVFIQNEYTKNSKKRS